MGRTKGKSRSSTASSARSVPYDLDLPENKTVAQLKYELSNRGIEFPKNAKKSQLRTGTFPGVSGATGCKQTWRPP